MVAIDLWQWSCQKLERERERERESCLAKTKILDSYSTKCTYFHVSIYFDRSRLVCVYVMFFHFVK